MIAFLFLLAHVSLASAGPAKLSEFCSVALPAIQAPFECGTERKSAGIVENVVNAYTGACPGLQEQFEILDQARQKLVRRCVLWNPNKNAEPSGCAEDRVVAARDLQAYRIKVDQLFGQVSRVVEAIGAEPPREINCRVYHEQHRFLLNTLRERLQNLIIAADRAEAEARQATPVKADRERVVAPEKKK
ncbi:MAG: hypothetical protein EOP11_10090 [Proteobacteria bacterium]|nr:MAG: hypothetical protein EOP11_10090 [Pseudomonadota bacterium]